MRRGDVVLLNFPFSSGGGAKVRPAVIIQSDSNNRRLQNTIVAMITTSTHLAAVASTQFLIDPRTPEGAMAGLLHPSAVKCENRFTVHQAAIIRVIGALHAAHLGRLDVCLNASLQLR